MFSWQLAEITFFFFFVIFYFISVNILLHSDYHSYRTKESDLNLNTNNSAAAGQTLRK